ncbi:phosphopantothenoylcysteine synthetase isoform X2 [Brevipalpus obovatus]
MEVSGEPIEDEMVKIETFFKNFKEPANLSDIRKRVETFISACTDKPIVMVTSGGTTVPMEHNTVRFVDNFSAGTRGSASAEHFLEKGYRVIFMYRTKSLEPFTRHVNVYQLLDSLSFGDGERLQLSVDLSRKLSSIVRKYTAHKENLLMVNFTTLSEYLFYLREIASALRPLRSRAVLYLAAAVSDFYIPSSLVATHKIESNGPLSLHLEIVPKMLRPLIKYWAPNTYVVSFKLETDENILLQKARKALLRYGHHLVIANQLHSRKKEVLIVTESENQKIVCNEDGVEIEAFIVDEVLKRHEDFRKASRSGSPEKVQV